MIEVHKSVTINRPIEQVYEFWRTLDRLPTFMQHLESVDVVGARESHWVARAPGGGTVEWDAQIVEERPNELLSWRSREGSEVDNVGLVRFSRAPADRGTEVHVQLSYDAPAGLVGATVAKLFGEEPEQQVSDDLRRFKQVMETGEVVRSDGSLEGAGQGALKQRPAQPPDQDEMQ